MEKKIDFHEYRRLKVIVHPLGIEYTIGRFVDGNA